MSDSVDLHIIDDIIARARDATSFAQVHNEYTSVLESHGIRPTTDKSYYEFLLKLGMIRATTWGERWDIWRTTNGVDLVPPPLSPVQHPLRARLPFLASASSDLDEGFAADSEAGGAESDVPLRGGRESPRKVIHRSLVGYTPEVSDTEATPPHRTSTPVQAQFSAYRQRERAHGPPRSAASTPPPYTESDTSQATLRSPISGLTPRARNRFMSPPKEVVYDIPDLEPTVVRQMEAQADAFYRFGLLGRCWGTWFQAAEWIMRTSERIDTIRGTILLRQSLQCWHSAYQHQLTLPGTADSHYAARTQSQVISKWLAKLRERRMEATGEHMERVKERKVLHGAWVSWRARLVKRRTKRWEEDIREREKDVVQRFESRQVAKVFDTWRDRTRERVADRHVDFIALRRTFSTWHGRAEKLRSLEQRVTDWERQHGTAALSNAFQLWRKKAHLGPAEEKFTAHRSGAVVARVWSQWRVATTRQSHARAFDEKRLISLTLTRMKKSIRKMRLRNRKALEFADQRDDELMRTMLVSWVREERSKLLERVLDTRRVRTSLTAWKGKLAKVQELDDKVTPFTARSDGRALALAVSRWRDVTGQKRNAALKADLVYAARTKSSSFVKWTAAATQAMENVATADKAYAFFVLRGSFKKWGEKCNRAITQRKVAEFTERRERNEMKAFMKAWRDATAQSILDRAAVEQHQAELDKRLLARSLAVWTTRVVELKSRELDIAEQRDVTLLASAFKRWKGARKRQTDLEALGESFIDVSREQTLRRSFARWSVRAHLAHDLRQRAEFLEAEHARRVLADMFELWNDKRRERELRSAEEEATLRHEDALLFSVFDKWTAKSRNLLAVQFDQRRVRASVLPRWERALERQRELKKVAGEHDRRLMVDAFAVWKASYLAKMAKKPYRARRRLQGSPVDREPYDRRQRYGSAPPEPERERERPTPRRDSTSARDPIARHRPSMPNLAARPRRSLQPTRSLGSPEVTSGPASVASEPAYSRLRNELAGAKEREAGRDPGQVGEWPGRRVVSGASSRSAGTAGTGTSGGEEGRRSPAPGMSELVRALRYGRV